MEGYCESVNITQCDDVERICYSTLLKIKQILEDDTLDDTDCFERIERIVVAFEEMGAGVVGRHDFG